MKRVARAGWVRRGVEAPESVAAHSWGVAWLVVALAPPGLDRGRALEYAVLHDLAEARVGDLTPADGVPAEEKHRREAAGLREIVRGLPGGEALAAVWERYERQEDAEARFVRQCDRLDMAVQAVAYARETGEDLGEFLASAAKVIEDEALRGVLEVLTRWERDEA
ncbi:MAG: HD domain-containing protein [Myxococcales bacterium]|nr:HD domain-containing protein [Myxococcales bacterium]